MQEEIWKITDHPPSDMNLKDREIIKINVMQPKAATPVHQLHFEIRADNKGVHHLINHQQVTRIVFHAHTTSLSLLSV